MREVPRHVAIIMDGNGRWAKQRGFPRLAGHRAGIESVREVIRAASEIGIRYLTLYTFSRENWKRPLDEVRGLMSLLKRLVRRETLELKRNNVRLKVIGRIHELPEDVQAELRWAMEETRENTGLTVYLALSYSGRAEVVDAIRKLAQEVQNGNLRPEAITEEVFRGFLYDPELPDPDLLIRTSGEMRISNFLLWQLAYTEIYITPTLWPDFRREEFLRAIEDYQRRERRFGGVPG